MSASCVASERPVVVDVKLASRCPARLQRAEQVAERCLEPGRLQVRRVDLDEQRPQLPDALTQASDRAAERRRLMARRRAASALVGERREPESDAGQILDDAVVQVRGDASPLLRRSLDRAGQQSLALAVAALEAAGQRPGERHLEEQQDQPGPPSSGGASARRRRSPLALTEPKRW